MRSTTSCLLHEETINETTDTQHNSHHYAERAVHTTSTVLREQPQDCREKTALTLALAPLSRRWSFMEKCRSCGALRASRSVTVKFDRNEHWSPAGKKKGLRADGET